MAHDALDEAQVLSGAVLTFVRRSLAYCFVSLRLRLKRVFTKMEFSCCKKPYSIRYMLLHRAVTNQST